jgi:hypothetical protein
VPEAAVDEDGDSLPSEGDVHMHAKPISAHKKVLAEAKTSTVQLGAKPSLGPRVGPPIPLAGLRGVS